MDALTQAFAEVYAQVEAEGWEEVLRRFGFDPLEVQDLVDAADRRDWDRATMACSCLVMGSIHEQGLQSAADALVGELEGGGIREEEFRVVWRREGLSRRVKLFQRREAAERKSLRLQGVFLSEPVVDPDGFVCCDGCEDGCGGLTNAQLRAQTRVMYEGLPPLVEGPRIEVREVGDWEMALP